MMEQIVGCPKCGARVLEGSFVLSNVGPVWICYACWEAERSLDSNFDANGTPVLGDPLHQVDADDRAEAAAAVDQDRAPNYRIALGRGVREQADGTWS